MIPLIITILSRALIRLHAVRLIGFVSNTKKNTQKSPTNAALIRHFKPIQTELGLECITHRVISDRVHRLLVTLSYFRPDRFVQLLSLIPILILLLYYLVSGCLTSLC